MCYNIVCMKFALHLQGHHSPTPYPAKVSDLKNLYFFINNSHQTFPQTMIYINLPLRHKIKPGSLSPSPQVYPALYLRDTVLAGLPCLSPRCLEFTAKKNLNYLIKNHFPPRGIRRKKAFLIKSLPKGLQIPPLLENPSGTFALDNKQYCQGFLLISHLKNRVFPLHMLTC